MENSILLRSILRPSFFLVFLAFSFARLFANADDYKVADIYRGLRDQVLNLHRETNVSESRGIRAVLMETGLKNASYTLVAIADGTASLYFSNGGGLIGCGEHPQGAAAARTLVEFTTRFEAAFKAVTKYPLPSVGRTRFYVVKDGSVLSVEFSEDELGNNRSEMSPLFHKAHELITVIQLIDDFRRERAAQSQTGAAQ